MNRMKVMTLTQWDAIPEGKRPIDTPVKLIDQQGCHVQWAWSPDGFGAYYYETMFDLRQEHC